MSACVTACKIKHFTEREFFLWRGEFCVFKTGIPGGPGARDTGFVTAGLAVIQDEVSITVTSIIIIYREPRVFKNSVFILLITARTTLQTVDSGYITPAGKLYFIFFIFQ